MQRKAHRTQAAYFRDTGIANSLQAALVRLFSHKLLPANPFYDLVEVLAGSQDQNTVWTLTPSQVAEGYRPDTVDVKISPAGTVARNGWGLPHVLLSTCSTGISIIADVLAQDLPPSFLPASQSVEADSDGYAVEVLPSLQGRGFSYQPRWQPFPLLEVRADVVVSGLDVRLALLKLARLVVKDATDLVSAGHFLQALILQAPPQADGTIPYYVPLSLDLLSSRDEDSVMRLLSGVTSDNSCIVCSMVIGISVPASGGAKGPKDWRYMPGTKSYHLHFRQLSPASEVPVQLTSFVVAPHEALFTGLFLEETAARRYLGLNAAATVYSQILPNTTLMLQQLALNYAAGQVMWAYSIIMLLSFLNNPQIVSSQAPEDFTIGAAVDSIGRPQLWDLVNSYNKARAAKLQGNQAVQDGSDRSESNSATEEDSASSASDEQPESKYAGSSKPVQAGGLGFRIEQQQQQTSVSYCSSSFTPCPEVQI